MLFARMASTLGSPWNKLPNVRYAGEVRGCRCRSSRLREDGVEEDGGGRLMGGKTGCRCN